MNRQKLTNTKKSAILQATMELVAEQGFAHTPTSQIAQKARVGVGTIYRYFTDKDELIHEVFTYVMQQETEAILRSHNAEAPLREQYIQLCSSLIKFSVQHPKHVKFLEQYFNSPYGISLRRERTLQRSSEEGKQPPLHVLFESAKAQQIVKDLPFTVLGALTFGPIVALTRDIHAGLLEYDADLMHKIVEACWDAVKR